MSTLAMKSTPSMKRSDVKRALQIGFIAQKGHIVCLADEPDVLTAERCFEIPYSEKYAEEVLSRDPAAVAKWLIPDPEPEKTYRKTQAVTAHLAVEDGQIVTLEGTMSYEAGQHYIVTAITAPPHSWPVRKDIFEDTYEEVPE